MKTIEVEGQVVCSSWNRVLSDKEIYEAIKSETKPWSNSDGTEMRRVQVALIKGNEDTIIIYKVAVKK